MPINDRLRSAPMTWTWRSALWAAAITLGVYLLLPWLEQLSSLTSQTVTLRSVSSVEMPPPPPPPPEPLRPPREQTRPEPPKPELQKMRRKLMPLQAKMDLSMALGDVGGDFSVHFGVSAPALDEQIRDLIFELGELDEPPRPLTRLKPIYPPQARLRRVEGWVELEFVVAADGTVRDVDVIAAQPAELFTRSATRAVQRWRFVPGTKDGQPVAARVRQKVTFQLD